MYDDDPGIATLLGWVREDPQFRVASFQCDLCDWIVVADPEGNFLDQMNQHAKDHTND